MSRNIVNNFYSDGFFFFYVANKMNFPNILALYSVRLPRSASPIGKESAYGVSDPRLTTDEVSFKFVAMNVQPLFFEFLD